MTEPGQPTPNAVTRTGLSWVRLAIHGLLTLGIALVLARVITALLAIDLENAHNGSRTLLIVAVAVITNRLLDRVWPLVPRR